MKYYSIAIDGPAGSGKSSVARELAKQLNFNYINSGSFYRAIAIFFHDKKINYNDPYSLNEKLLDDNINLSWKDNKIFLNDEDISEKIGENFVSRIASVIATYPVVRTFVNKNILEISDSNSIVVDGRDIGTIVLPKATAKIFLDADIKTRAIRRMKQLQSSGNTRMSLEQIVADLIERDNRDYSRELAPLAKANDAVVLDNSLMSFEETVDAIKKIYMGKVINEDWQA